jgi:prophage regulatory protein
VANEILRLPGVIGTYGKRRSAIYDDIRHGLFPRQVSLGPRAVGWPASEVHAVIAARIAGHSTEQIKTLVRRLEASRCSTCNDFVGCR